MGCWSSQEKSIVSPPGDVVEGDFISSKPARDNQEMPLSGYEFSRSPTNEGHDAVSRFTGNEEQALYEVIYNKDWEAAAILLKNPKFRIYVTHMDRNGRTCLHWACIKKSPLSIIKMLLDGYSNKVALLLKEDNFGQTPVHMAVEYCSKEVITLMLNYCSGVSLGKDKSGSTPLISALLCERGPMIVKHLLVTDPSQIKLADKYGRLPMDLFFNKHLRQLIDYNINNIDPVTGFSSRVVLHDAAVKGIYEVANYMFQADVYTNKHPVAAKNQVETYNHTKKEQPVFSISDKWHVLHAAIECPQCPYQFVDLILRLYPEDATRKDHNQKTPLHIACSLMSTTTYISDTKESSPGSNKEEADADTVDKISMCIKTLVSSHPELAKEVDSDGNYPLHLALKAGKTLDSGICDLLLAYTDALLILDEESRMYPFMMAASADFIHESQGNIDNNSSNDDNEQEKAENTTLTTAFHLLLMKPDVLSYDYLIHVGAEKGIIVVVEEVEDVESSHEVPVALAWELPEDERQLSEV